MKAAYLIQALLLLGPAYGQKQVPLRDQYTAICPSQNGTLKTLENGTTVKYHCDKRAPKENYLGQKRAPTPEDCAALCRQNAKCQGSAWLYSPQVCQLFSYSGEPGNVLRGAVYLEIQPEKIQAGTGEKADCVDVQNALNDCEASETQLRGQISDCEKGAKSTQETLTDCELSQAQLQGQITDLEQSNNDLKSQIKDLERSNSDLQTGLDTCTVEKDRIQQDLATESGLLHQCLADKTQYEQEAATEADLKRECLAERDYQKSLCDSDKASLSRDLQACRDASRNQGPPPCTQRTLRTVSITSQGYFQNGGYLPENQNQLVVSWQSGNTRDVWAIHDDMGPLPFIHPYPGGQQKSRQVAVCGRVYCPSAPQVSFNVV